MLEVTPCPASSYVNMDVTAFEIKEAEIGIYDISGRLLCTLGSTLLYPGTSRFAWQPDGASPGVCFVRLTAGEFETTQRFVVIVA